MTDGYYNHEISPIQPPAESGLVRVYYYFMYKGYKYIKVMDVPTKLVDDLNTIKFMESIAMKEAEESYNEMVSTIQTE